MFGKVNSNWLNQVCQEIEALEQLHDACDEHKNLKEAVGIFRTKMPSTLVNNENKIVTVTVSVGKMIIDHKKLKRYQDHLQQTTNYVTLIIALRITKTEIIKNIFMMIFIPIKNRNANKGSENIIS